MILGIINIILKISKRVKKISQNKTSFQFHDGKIICLLLFIFIYENLPNMGIFFGIFIWIITATSIFPIHIVSMIFAVFEYFWYLRPLINQKIIKFCHLQELKSKEKSSFDIQVWKHQDFGFDMYLNKNVVFYFRFQEVSIKIFFLDLDLWIFFFQLVDFFHIHETSCHS